MDALSVLVAIATAGMVVAGLTFRRLDGQRQRAMEHDLGGVVSQRGRATMADITLLVDDNRFILETYHDRGLRSRDSGDHAAAADWLERGCQAIEAFAPDFLTALGALRGLARSVSVIVPLPALRPFGFSAWHLRGAASMAAVLHLVLFTGQERVRLRLRVIRYAFGMSVRWLRRGTNEVAIRPAAPDAWHRVAVAVHDIEVAGDETMATARRIVQALDAVEMRFERRLREARSVK